MIGVFDYTVILTYCSLISAVTGIILGFNGNALGSVICLLLCGLFDMFDGRVARTKKHRTDFEKSFGIQIDSLSDLVAFGILPVAIGYSIGYVNYCFIPIYCFFVLSGLVRLAYFNSLEIENKDKKEKVYIGVPITTSAFVFPLLYVFRTLSCFKYLYAGCLFLLAILFVSKIRIKKPSKKFIILFLIIGIIEFILIFKGHIW